jgi:hypothetical protein
MSSALPEVYRPRASAAQQPQLFVVVDTEEEFDWDAPYSRANVGVTAMRHIGRAQQIFDRFGIKPTYVIDYPVASQADGYEPLRDIWQDGRCTIGAHVHPWVNPPYEEDLNPENSFIKNLPERLRRAKLQVLMDAITKRFERPRVFKAGRYGISAAMVPLLEQLGFEVDNSVCPRHDFSAQNGPTFADLDSTPFFLTPGLLEIPCTVDYTGWAGSWRPALHRAASSPLMSRFPAVGVLAKAQVSNRIMLSPEGNTCEDMKSLATALLKRGLRTFTLTFHSPSVAPGHTSYVRTEADLSGFLRSIEQFCEFFMTRLVGVPATPLEYRSSLLSPAGLSA